MKPREQRTVDTKKRATGSESYRVRPNNYIVPDKVRKPRRGVFWGGEENPKYAKYFVAWCRVDGKLRRVGRMVDSGSENVKEENMTIF